MRNITKHIEAGRGLVTSHTDLHVTELYELITPYYNSPNNNGLFKAVTNAFYVGVATGYRINKKGK